MTDRVHAIVLAAGQGTRMKSAKPKVLHPVGGKPMLGHVLDAATAAGITQAHLVLGHGAVQVRDWLSTRPGAAVDTVIQAEQLGTAHAVSQAMPEVPDEARVIVLYGDVPLMSAATLKALVAAAADGFALLTVTLDEPRGYGRILRDSYGRVTGIVEEKDASEAQRAIREVNTGLIATSARRLRRWLSHVGNDNANREYYLTDVVGLAARDGIIVRTIEAATAEEVEGVNDPLQLARAERVFQRREA